MPITVAQLAADSDQLGLTVLSGHVGLRHEISWAHTSELVDPTPWLDGGELLLTLGLSLPVDQVGRDEYVARLARAGLAGLAFDTGMVHEQVPAEVVAAGDRYGLPVLAVSARTSFIAISKRIITTLNADRVNEVALISQHQDRVAEGALTAGPVGALEALSAALGVTTALVDPAGRVVRACGTGLPQLEAQLRVVWARPRRPVSMTHADDSGILMLQTLDTDQPSPMALAVWASRPLSQHERLLVSHAVTVLALATRTSRSVRTIERRVREAAFRVLLAGDDPAHDDLVESFGFGEGQPLVVLVLTGTDQVGELLPVVERQLVRTGVTHLVTTAGHEVVVAAAVGNAARLATGLQSAARKALGLRPVVGTSGSVGVRELRSGLAQARAAALTAAAQESRRADYTSLGLTALLLGSQTDEALEVVCDSVLGPLEDYDRSHGGGLVKALDAYLHHCGHWGRAADEAGIHRHTLRRKVRLAASLLDRDLDSLSGMAEVWLTLQARARLHGHAVPPGPARP
ncbi:PucR family transcriptional regulator [Intrasporangium sp.]|uniref:PucR family transcriptional regulator n=1 Tax=Intrasporangium sp. TaxID=1925024 RepID=UPI0032218506